jgi:hypothetical protein
MNRERSLVYQEINGGGTTKAISPSSSREDEGFLLPLARAKLCIGRKGTVWITTKVILI